MNAIFISLVIVPAGRIGCLLGGEIAEQRCCFLRSVNGSGRFFRLLLQRNRGRSASRKYGRFFRIFFVLHIAPALAAEQLNEDRNLFPARRTVLILILFFHRIGNSLTRTLGLGGSSGLLSATLRSLSRALRFLLIMAAHFLIWVRIKRTNST